MPTPPGSARAARVLLYVAAGLTSMSALDAWLEIGGLSGLGQATVLCVPVVVGVLLARRVGRPGPWTWSAILALETFYLLWQLGRIAAGDPLGLLGLTFPTAIIACVTRPAAREYLRIRPWRRRCPGLRRPTSDRGSVTVSQVGLVALVAGVVTALLAGGLPGTVSSAAGRALCPLVQAACEDPAPGDGATAAPPASSVPQPAQPIRADDGDRPTVPDEEYDKPLNCWWWAQGVCDLGQGAWIGTVDTVQGLNDGAGLIVCLSYLCGGDKFDQTVDTWDALLTTNPLDTAQQVWDGTTRDHVNDWSTGHGWRSIGRLAPDVLGAVFGSKGVHRLAKLPDGPDGPDQPAVQQPVHPPVLYKDAEMTDGGRSWDRLNNVPILTRAQREHYRITPRRDPDGVVRLYDSKGRRFDSSTASPLHPGDESGRAIFVMLKNGDFFASAYHAPGRFHHSTLAAGDRVAAAGQLKVIDGRLVAYDDRSGHYQPQRWQTRQFVDWLERSGVDLDGVDVHLEAPPN
ncbi:hypothetical protein SAMN04489712_105191 [Thermomonospora echinospora]|uniref:Uncharacterized protein n=1 Tax=Thermomonospora echinospora TaxID=1992 RepID=A0A1H6A3N5_9ACTN|nr:hypothetical protein [Thermomonospora echinospora]SEG43353.1 hypothetical protein SAMN04489712_105191 [Thermomonospora echinospora]